MIEVITRKQTYPRKGTEYVVILMEDDHQLTCVHPFTPYLATAEMVSAAFKSLLATPEGEKFVREQIAELP